MAKRYIWWQTPAESLRHPDRIIAQVMNLGTLEDADQLETLLAPSALIAVLHHATPGWFRPRSWSYWHYRLGLIDSQQPVPSLPARMISA